MLMKFAAFALQKKMAVARHQTEAHERRGHEGALLIPKANKYKHKHAATGPGRRDSRPPECCRGGKLTEEQGRVMRPWVL